MNGLARTLANTSTQIAKIDHHHSRHLTHSQEPVQNTILPDKNHRLDYWSQLGEYQHLLLWNSLFLRWEITSDHRLEHLTGFLERTLLLQTGGRRRGPTAPRSQDPDGFFEPCARTARDTGGWSPNTRPGTSLRDRQVPPKPATSCQSETFHGLRMTVAKGRNFESSSHGHQGSSRNIPFESCVCSVQVCWLAGVWNFRFGDIPHGSSSGFFFSRAPSRPWRGRPHLRRAWTLWAPKNPALLRSCLRTWRQRRYRRAVWLSSKWRLNQRGLRDYFYSK